MSIANYASHWAAAERFVADGVNGGLYKRQFGGGGAGGAGGMTQPGQLPMAIPPQGSPQQFGGGGGGQQQFGAPPQQQFGAPQQQQFGGGAAGAPGSQFPPQNMQMPMSGTPTQPMPSFQQPGSGGGMPPPNPMPAPTNAGGPNLNPAGAGPNGGANPANIVPPNLSGTTATVNSNNNNNQLNGNNNNGTAKPNAGARTHGKSSQTISIAFGVLGLATFFLVQA